MGQNGRRARAVLGLAGVGAAATVIAGCGSAPLASASTVLRSALRVSVVHPDGSRVPGVPGMVLARGDEVVTGRGGSATLVTRARRVYLVSRSALVVGNGVRQALRRGSAIVDAAAGDGESVSMTGFTVDVPGGAVSRLDAGVARRVGAFAGTTRVATPGGAAVAVPALHQVMLGGDTVSLRTTALHLTDDAAEAAVAPGLVREDLQLIALARGIDGTGVTTVSQLSGAPPAAPAMRGTRRSDRVLPLVLARAAGGGVAADYRAALRWRAQGGSWGVIARLLGTDAAAAATELAALERTTGRGVGQVVAAALARQGSAPTHPAAPPSTPVPSPSRSAIPTRTPQPTPSPSPSSGPVQRLVGTVLGLLHKLPLPTATSPGLLGRLP